MSGGLGALAGADPHAGPGEALPGVPGELDAAVDRMESWRPEGIDPDRVMSCDHQAMLGVLQLVQAVSTAPREDAALPAAWRRQCERVLAKEFAAATRLMKTGRL